MTMYDQSPIIPSKSSRLICKKSEYDQEMSQIHTADHQTLQTYHRHCEKETHNTNSHMTSKRQSKTTNTLG